MPISSMLLILALLVLVAAIVARPFWKTEKDDWTQAEGQSVLLAERERIIEALLELDFDYKLGKVPEDIFNSQRLYLVDKGAQVLKQLDTEGTKANKTSLDANDDIERLIAARKANRD